MKRTTALAVGLLLAMLPADRQAGASSFDHRYPAYADVLARYVRVPVSITRRSKADRGRLDRAIAEFNAPSASGEAGWSREQRMAFWINAYNAFTLRAIVDHYPIRNGWQYLDPFNNLLFFTAWTMLATCVALYLLRDFDPRWSVDAATHRRR